MENKIRNLGLVALIAMTGMGCSPRYESFEKLGKFEGYEVRIGLGIGHRHIGIAEKIDPSALEKPMLQAVDYDNKGRFDEIRLWHVPKGHQLEQYASLGALEKVYKTILDQDKEKYQK